MSCLREAEVLGVILDGRWSALDGSELHAHAAACSTCGELALVSSQIHEDYVSALQTAAVPPSGLVWWRVQRRVREEVMQEAARAITFVQTASVVAAIAIALTILGGLAAFSATCRGWMMRASDALYFGAVHLPSSTPLIAGAVAIAMLAPFALYFAFARE